MRNVFEPVIPRTPSLIPKPIEIAVYARQSWLHRYCSIEILLEKWVEWAQWDSHQDELISWFLSLPDHQIDQLCPLFTEDEGTLDGVWKGWEFRFGAMRYATYPRKIVDKTQTSIQPPDDGSGYDLPFLAYLQPGEDLWCRWGNHAWNSWFEDNDKDLPFGGPERIGKSEDDEDDDPYIPAWDRTRFTWTASAMVSWVCRLSEEERMSIRPMGSIRYQKGHLIDSSVRSHLEDPSGLPYGLISRLERLGDV
jgi:hypothetical protein